MTYNPVVDNQDRNKSLNKEIASEALSGIIRLDASPSENSLDIVRENGIEGVSAALMDGYSWSSIAKHVGCSVYTLRTHWLETLTDEEKQFIGWAETQHAKKIPTHILNKMLALIASDGMEGIDTNNLAPDEVSELKTKALGRKSKEIAMLQRVADTASKYLNSQGGESGGSKEQVAPPVINITMGKDTGAILAGFGDDTKIINP